MCEDDDNKDEKQGNQAVEAALSQGLWKVAYFFDKQDETSNFDGYSFTFNDNMVAFATRNSLSVQGTWDTEDSSDGETKLYLDFGASTPLEELSEDWVVIESSSLRITLEHVSGGNGDTDSLVLERK
jgi:hypothetical protein